MTTYTKRQYALDLAANDRLAAGVAERLEGFHARLETCKSAAVMADEWNAAYDSKWNITQDRRAIERRWLTRKWTHADHAFAELVFSNID